MQVYMSSKNQLDSEGNNPYPKTDNSGVVLALNEATSVLPRRRWGRADEARRPLAIVS